MPRNARSNIECIILFNPHIFSRFIDLIKDLITVIPRYLQGIGLGAPRVRKSADAHWPSVSKVPHPQIQPTTDRVVPFVFTEKQSACKGDPRTSSPCGSRIICTCARV